MDFKNWLEQRRATPRARHDVYQYEAEEIPIGQNAWAHALFNVDFIANPPTPDVWYLPNGDPGYPGDPGGVEIQDIKLHNITVYDDEGNEVYEGKAPPGGLQKWLVNWAWSKENDIEQEIWDNMDQFDDGDDRY